MKLDLSRFHETFFQESLEGLSVMESGLLTLSISKAEPDLEIIHNVFRAAHSIKGGSATFGFEEIAEFTHLLEAILDYLRDKGSVPDAPTSEVLLESIDSLRELIAARMESREPDRAMLRKATAELSRILALLKETAPDAVGTRTAPPPDAAKLQPDLIVSFHPHENIFFSGNDPLTYLADLDRLAKLDSKIDLSRLPKLAALNSEISYLKWEVKMREVSCSEMAVRDVFEWIEGDCDVEITGEIASVIASGNAVAETLAKTPKASITSAAKSESSGAGSSKDASTIRVSTEKIDAVVNLVGELVITQSMLTCISDDFRVSQLTKLKEGIGQLTRNTRELQETVLKIRMLPIGSLFDRFPRLIHDLSRKLSKTVALKISGEQTEVDKTVLEKLSDPLVHLVRNSMDHGIERPEDRREAGKPEEGTLHLHAEHRGGNVLIEITDDGAGLNEARIVARAKERGLIGATDVLSSAEIHGLIFAPGFSTVEQVTDLSGRGVGMDVVRRNVEELGGRIHLTSRPGLGTTTTIQLPLTLAIMEGQLLRVGEQRFVVPLTSIVESLRVKKSSLHTVLSGVQGGLQGADMYRLRDEYLRVVHLDRLFNLGCETKPVEEGLLVVVESRGKRMALRIDDLLAQQQVVIKSLEANFYKVEGVAGATILGDGTVALILDIPGLMELSQAVSAGSFEEVGRT